MKYSELSLTWFGDVTSIGEEAKYARAILKPLIDNGAKIRLELLNSGLPQENLSPWWQETLVRLTQNQSGFIRINHCNPDKGTNNPLGGPNVCLCHWDTIEFPNNWQSLTNMYSQFWITNFCESPFIVGTKVPVNSFPCIFYSSEQSAAKLPDCEFNAVDTGTVILGAAGPWNQRSNMHDLIAAYCVEFSAKEDVCLALVINSSTQDPNQKAQILSLIRSIKNTINKPDLPKIICIQDQLSELSFAKLVNSFDIYVSTARGSSIDPAFNQALANGALCVTPRTGIYTTVNRILGTTNKQIRAVNVVKEPIINSPGANPYDRWTRIDIDHLCKEMRNAFIDSQTMDSSLKKKIEENKLTIDTKLSAESIVDRMATELIAMMPFKIKAF